VTIYLRGFNGQDYRAGVEAIDGTTWCGFCNTWGGVTIRSMVDSYAKCNEHLKSSFQTRMELSLSCG
jgi:hypothetical protein